MQRKGTNGRRLQLLSRPMIEAMELRQMLSASTITVEPALTLTASAATSTTAGLTPAQIKAAYGLTSVSGNGTGQTIAIVDAYNDPNLVSDLHTFDTAYGLSDPKLTVESQTGSTTSLPATSAAWAEEISLDVEWAHAIAPGASILLVEASSSSLSNLLTAVNTARNATGVSVVSMSWGSTEFTSESAYDSYFATPSGHQGITFVAAAGDDGSSAGPDWPATSPYVLSVGGSTLSLTSSGSYSSESAWSGGGGGTSSLEGEPSYQSSAQSTGRRTGPDVSYDASPSTGFAVYDSLSYEGYSGWQEYGGTSAGAPQWAAIVAIADQGRASAGKSTLDGASGTLPALYALYASPTSASYSTYLSYFNDISSGSTSSSVSAKAGYDEATGLGTPHADKVISALVAATNTATTTTTTTTTTSTPRRSPWRWYALAASNTPLNAQPAAVSEASASAAVEVTTAPTILNQLTSAPTTVAKATATDNGGFATTIAARGTPTISFASTTEIAAAARSAAPAVVDDNDVSLTTAPGAATLAVQNGNGPTLKGAPADGKSIAAAVRATELSTAAAALVAKRGQTSSDDPTPGSSSTVTTTMLCAGGVLVGVAYARASAKSREEEQKRAPWPFALTGALAR